MLPQYIAVVNGLLYARARQFGADGVRIGIRPFEGERAALIRFYRIQATKIIFVKIHTSSIGPALQHQPLAIRRKLGFIGDEFTFIHAKIGGDPRNLRVRNAHDAVLYPAARPAHPALELVQFHLFASFAFFAAKH